MPAVKTTPFRYYSSCVDWPPALIEVEGGLCDLVASLEEISRATFLRRVDSEDRRRLETSLGYAAHLRDGLTISRDYHVRYKRGQLHGRMAYVLVHSAIEHVFAPFERGAEPIHP